MLDIHTIRTRITESRADPWPNQIRLSDLDPKFVCSACGKRGADIRPDFHWDKPARSDYFLCAGETAHSQQHLPNKL